MVGDMLEVDGGVLWVRDKAAACSEAGVEAVACSEVGDEASACSGAGIEDGSVAVSRVTEERERLAVLKNC
jgi:hypothetical protein